ncbi:MAG: arsenate reductase family protein [Solobacterium sp.]|nr:arsenate reductase family protein [Solobacterium sp.]
MKYGTASCAMNGRKKEGNNMYTFICYEKCGTCRKAEKWLKENNIAYTKRFINEDNPSAEELKEWIPQSGRDLRKFFNTSGKRYREGNIKERLKTMTDEEVYDLLASDGMLVKRPVLVGEGAVLSGFNEEEWTAALKQK